jgi:hypothetical protein
MLAFPIMHTRKYDCCLACKFLIFRIEWFMLFQYDDDTISEWQKTIHNRFHNKHNYRNTLKLSFGSNNIQQI